MVAVSCFPVASSRWLFSRGKPMSHGSHRKRRRALVVAEMTATPTRSTDVVIIGGGVAGLRAAQTLTAAGVEFVLVEAEAQVGGRVRTERTEEGFLLDHGFQILLTAYPEVQEALAGYKDLQLESFFAGARVRFDGEFHTVADPFRAPLQGLQSLANPIGSVWDKVLVGVVRSSTLLAWQAIDLFDRPEKTIADKLKDSGFSESIVDRFFRPFLGGIFFDRSLSTTSRLLDFVLRMLAIGNNCLPTRGIGAISEQMLKSIGEESVVYGCKITSLQKDSDGSVTAASADGNTIWAKYGCIVATEGPVAMQLLGDNITQYPSAEGSPVGTTCLYYSIDGPPPPEAEDPILFLNGDGPSSGPINNMCFPSVVSSTYAPASKTLASVSLLGVTDASQDSLDADVRKQLQDWFPRGNVSDWKLLKVFRIPYAQPPQPLPSRQRREARLDRGIYVAGDHRSDATLDGAMRSGRYAAEALLKDYDELVVANKALSASK